MERVLVVDDDKDCRSALAETLESLGYSPETAPNGRAALERLTRNPSDYGLVYTDLQMPEVGGLELVKEVGQLDPTIVSVLLTGFPSSNSAIAALRVGAYDFLPKPYSTSELETSLARATERRRVLLKHEQYRSQLERRVVEGDAEITRTNEKLHGLYTLGADAYSFIDPGPKLNDFAQFATDHFRPDTFGILVQLDAALKPLVFYDRYGRIFEGREQQNQKAFRFQMEHSSFRGQIYLGYDGAERVLLESQKHIFGLFRERLGSYLNEHYTAQQHREEMRKIFVSSVQAHARSIEAKDVYTAGHCDRVDRYAELLARQSGRFDEPWIFNLKVASILHDIGKIGVRGAVLCKPSSLDEFEAKEIQTHPVIGGRIVRTLYGFNLEPAVRHHHERFDGKGYPSHLKGEQIPVESRIILIADTFDAMTSDRPYRRAMTTERAIDELKRHSGTQFDPEFVSIAQEAAGELEKVRQEMETKPQGDYFAS